jgi:hypothetical protein
MNVASTGAGDEFNRLGAVENDKILMVNLADIRQTAGQDSHPP